jgi:RsiW-degrading membrane proteinase PrsW (M82 family)
VFGSQQAIINLSFFSILPAILILFFVYKRDQFPEPPRVVFITLILGFGITLPISLLIPIAEGFIENIKWGVESKVFFQAFVRAAFLEETMKFLVLVIYCLHLDKFDEPMDALVYGVAASLGFAAYENWQYVMNAYSVQGAEFAKEVISIRSYTAVPLHALCGVFMGFFLMDAAFEREHNRLNLFLSLFFPVCLHGLYDYILMSENFSIQFMWIYILIGMFVVRAYFIFRKQSKLQVERGNSESREKFIPPAKDIAFTVLVSGFLIIGVNYFLNMYMY